jgi:hypothetical protein
VDDYGDWMVLMNGLCGCMVVVVVVVIGCSGSWEGMEIEGVTEYGGGGGGGGALVVMGGGRGRCWGWIMDMGVVRGSAAQRMQQSAEQCRHYRRRMRTNWGGGGWKQAARQDDFGGSIRQKGNGKGSEKIPSENRWMADREFVAIKQTTHTHKDSEQQRVTASRHSIRHAVPGTAASPKQIPPGKKRRLMLW